jgi:hypothetical protein
MRATPAIGQRVGADDLASVLDSRTILIVRRVLICRRPQ